MKNNVTTRLKNIREFTLIVNEGIKKNPGDEPDNKDLLMSVMKHIRDISVIYESTLDMFSPMRDQISLLKKHGVQIDEDIVMGLDNDKEAWIETNRIVYDIRSSILQLKEKEATNIRKQLEEFTEKVKIFREEFVIALPFRIDEFSDKTINDAYVLIDDYKLKLDIIKLEKERINDLETLFELTPSGHRSLRECIEELKSLKLLWDACMVVHSMYNSWKKTLWDKIDTEDLLEQNKNLTNTVKTMPKEVRTWKTYANLNDKVKNMTIILPLISDLHSE